MYAISYRAPTDEEDKIGGNAVGLYSFAIVFPIPSEWNMMRGG